MTEIKKEDYDRYLAEDLLSLKEAAEMLDVSEEELRGLVKRHQVASHQVAGAFLRLKKNDVEDLKNKWRIERELFPRTEPYFAHETTVTKAGLFEKLADFWYFNDFYILCSILIMLLLYVILSAQ